MRKKINHIYLNVIIATSCLVLFAAPLSATIHTITGNAGGGLGSNFTMLNATGITGGATDVSGTFDDSLICAASACNSFAMTLSSTQPFFGVPWAAHSIRVFGPGTYTIDTDCTREDFDANRFDCDPSNDRAGTAYPNNDPTVGDPTAPADSQEGPDITFTVAEGQLVGHILFNWLVSTNIHVPVLWDFNQTFTLPADAAFPAIDQALIYDGSDAIITCTAVGIPNPRCDTTHDAVRVYKFASHDGNGAATITRYVTNTLTKAVDTSVVEADGIRGFTMVNGPFAGQNANFNIDMTPGYTPPIATVDSSSTVAGVLRNIDVIGNDSDFEDGTPPGGSVTLTTPTSAKGGTLVNVGDGTVNYTSVGLTSPDTDTFQYTVTDSIGVVSNTATVTVTITAFVNSPPVANDVIFDATEDTAAAINISDTDLFTTAIATDADSGQALTFATVTSPTAQGGTVVIETASADITYTPAQNFNGVDTFNFAVFDTIENSPTAIMTFDVVAVNDAPTCADVSLNTTPDTALVIDKASDLLASCSDVDGDTPLFDMATQPATPGSVVADNGTTLTYTPAAGFEGDDTFSFDVSDGNGGVVTATVTVSVGQLFSNFTMLDSAGNTFGGTNDVLFTWDETTFNTDEADTNFGVMTIASVKPQAFFSFFWTAHHIRVYGPGSYSFDTACTTAQFDTGITSCGGSNPLTMTVGAGQIGAHILFDWGKPTTATPCGVENCDIDVVNVWQENAAWDRLGAIETKNALFLGAAGPAPVLSTSWALVSTDVNGDGVNGAPMVDGPFNGFYANFNALTIFPPGTVIGPPPTSNVPAVPHTQQDTKLGDSLLATMNVFGLLAGLLVLLGLRQTGRKK